MIYQPDTLFNQMELLLHIVDVIKALPTGRIIITREDESVDFILIFRYICKIF